MTVKVKDTDEFLELATKTEEWMHHLFPHVDRMDMKMTVMNYLLRHTIILNPPQEWQGNPS
jgi:hypothetical protein